MRCRSSRRALLGFLFACAGVAAAPGFVRAAFVDETALYGIAAGDSMSYTGNFQDFDGDGDVDFLVNNHWRGGGQLFRNDGVVPWVPITDFLGTTNADRHDVVWGDFDNSGSPDLYIIRGSEQENELFWNAGGGVMKEGAAAAGVADVDGRGREVTLADFNLDGLVDIFIVNDFRLGFTKPSRLFLNNGNGTFLFYPNNTPMFFSRLHVTSNDYDLDGDMDILTTNPPWVPGEVWRNDGNFVFTEVRDAVFPGITSPLIEANGLSWGDYDNDGDDDLFACGGNRTMWDFAAIEGDSLRWYVECDPAEEKRIELVTLADSVTVWAATATYDPLACRYGAAGDSAMAFPVTLALVDLAGEPPLHATGSFGLYIWSTPAASGDSVHVVILSDTTKTEEWIVGGAVRANSPGISSWAVDGFEERPGYSTGDFTNRLFRNDGGKFAEVTSTAFSVNDPVVSSAGAAWGDYDCDGWLDVYVANSGNIETGNVANYLYRNNGDGTFSEIAAIEGVEGSTRGIGDGAAWADVNGDGFLDLYTDNGGEHPPFGVGPRQLFTNSGNGNHFLKFDLRTFASNASGIGARLRLVTPSGTQHRTVLGDSDNCFSGPLTVHFGLGSDTQADSLIVTWPNGGVTKYASIAADQGYWVLQGKPLRAYGEPNFICVPVAVVGTLNEGGIRAWSVDVDNYGGAAAVFGARYEDCAGAPISWLTVDPDTGGVWPGGTDPFVVIADATSLAPGSHCGRVIFETNGTNGPDTLRVNLTVNDGAVGVELPPGAPPHRLTLGRVRPNPARGDVSVSLGLPQPGEVQASVYDVAGRVVATLTRGHLPAGWHTLTWSGRGDDRRPVAAGVYLLRAQWGVEHAIRKIVRVD